MQSNPTLYDKLYALAEKGGTSANVYAWKKQIEKLEKDGLVITVDSSRPPIKKGKYFVNISWEKGGAPGTLAARLYILAENSKKN